MFFLVLHRDGSCVYEPHPTDMHMITRTANIFRKKKGSFGCTAGKIYVSHCLNNPCCRRKSHQLAHHVRCSFVPVLLSYRTDLPPTSMPWPKEFFCRGSERGRGGDEEGKKRGRRGCLHPSQAEPMTYTGNCTHRCPPRAWTQSLGPSCNTLVQSALVRWSRELSHGRGGRGIEFAREKMPDPSTQGPESFVHVARLLQPRVHCETIGVGNGSLQDWCHNVR